MEEDKLLLLQLIKNNGKIENLTKKGYEYSEIAKMISDFIEQELISFSPDKIELTDAGENEWRLLNNQFKKKKIDKFISPQSEYLLEEKKSIYDVYLSDEF
ncbi:hypothetical protein ACZ11_23815 [Lysinibacillus xylanilyticus]|uniref:Uncharacterized protein n=1 Tax=Lysinibacillus xylanilyticus TaxID=582475 RepID=A0A0K9F148_9BACI|nr:hypothetical protein [Lysinibacillus xylanilyticus]KMY28265.1 hypothetical protein ACZ11_23815 [Lysinibacillus xylanilyticus]